LHPGFRLVQTPRKEAGKGKTRRENKKKTSDPWKPGTCGSTNLDLVHSVIAKRKDRRRGLGCVKRKGSASGRPDFAGGGSQLQAHGQDRRTVKADRNKSEGSKKIERQPIGHTSAEEYVGRGPKWRDSIIGKGGRGSRRGGGEPKLPGDIAGSLVTSWGLGKRERRKAGGGGGHLTQNNPISKYRDNQGNRWRKEKIPAGRRQRSRKTTQCPDGSDRGQSAKKRRFQKGWRGGVRTKAGTSDRRSDVLETVSRGGSWRIQNNLGKKRSPRWAAGDEKLRRDEPGGGREVRKWRQEEGLRIWQLEKLVALLGEAASARMETHDLSILFHKRRWGFTSL